MSASCLVLAVVLLVRPAVLAAETSPVPTDPATLAQHIDDYFAAYWQRVGVSPAEPASDAEFARRAYLDLVGRIPTAGELRWLLADEAENKRQLLVDQLLDSPEHVEAFKDLWLDLLIPEAAADQQVRYVSLEFEAWMRKQLSENRPYDQWVRELLELPLAASGQQGPYMFYSTSPEPRPTAFYAAKDVKPEALAATTARTFLGLRVDCAQCHDHPFAHWKQQEFWSYAAFFQGLERTKSSGLADLFRSSTAGPLTIRIPDSTLEVNAAFLDGQLPPQQPTGPRELVAAWITRPENPYFARAEVNRLWGHLFGRGLVEPLDDLDAASFSEHAALLEDMARQFAQSGFDVKFVLRGIMNSRPYQLAGRATNGRQRDTQHFARKAPRKMTAIQIYNSLEQVRGAAYADFLAQPFQTIDFRSQRSQFVQLFDESAEHPLERSTAVAEALALMNGPSTLAVTDQPDAPLLTAIVDMPDATAEQRIETLFLATLSRPPSEQELAGLLMRYTEAASAEEQRAFYSDVLWALVNSSPFMLN